MTMERESLLRQAANKRGLAARTRRLKPQLPSYAVRAELEEFASQLDDRADVLEGEAIRIRATMQPAMLWRLLPVQGTRSKNWSRSLYDGSVGPVVVRAQSALNARFLAAEEFDRTAPSANFPLNSPWLDEADTAIETCTDGRFEAVGATGVLHPSRRQVTPG